MDERCECKKKRKAPRNPFKRPTIINNDRTIDEMKKRNEKIKRMIREAYRYELKGVYF